MITVISGTNRKNSRTRLIAQAYHDILTGFTQEECKILALEELPGDIISDMMYEKAFQNPALALIQDEFFTPAEKLIFVVPEYNGSIPGIFKLFIDAISIRNYEANFKDKKVGLIGVATGRGGNLRGLDHLTTSLNYLKMIIFPNRYPISQVDKVIDKSGQILDPVLQQDLEKHAQEFLEF